MSSFAIPTNSRKLSKRKRVVEEEEFSKIYDKPLKAFDDNYLNELKTKYEGLGFSFVLPFSDGTYGRWRWGYSTKNKERLKYDVIVNKNGSKSAISMHTKAQLGVGVFLSPKFEQL